MCLEMHQYITLPTYGLRAMLNRCETSPEMATNTTITRGFCRLQENPKALRNSFLRKALCYYPDQDSNLEPTA